MHKLKHVLIVLGRSVVHTAVAEPGGQEADSSSIVNTVVAEPGGQEADS